MSVRCAEPNCQLRLVPSQIADGQLFCTLHQARRDTETRRELVRDQLGQVSDIEELKVWLGEYVVGLAQERVR